MSLSFVLITFAYPLPLISNLNLYFLAPSQLRWWKTCFYKREILLMLRTPVCQREHLLSCSLTLRTSWMYPTQKPCELSVVTRSSLWWPSFCIFFNCLVSLIYPRCVNLKLGDNIKELLLFDHRRHYHGCL